MAAALETLVSRLAIPLLVFLYFYFFSSVDPTWWLVWTILTAPLSFWFFHVLRGLSVEYGKLTFDWQKANTALFKNPDVGILTALTFIASNLLYLTLINPILGITSYALALIFVTYIHHWVDNPWKLWKPTRSEGETTNKGFIVFIRFVTNIIRQQWYFAIFTLPVLFATLGASWLISDQRIGISLTFAVVGLIISFGLNVFSPFRYSFLGEHKALGDLTPQNRYLYGDYLYTRFDEFNFSVILGFIIAYFGGIMYWIHSFDMKPLDPLFFVLLSVGSYLAGQLVALSLHVINNLFPRFKFDGRYGAEAKGFVSPKGLSHRDDPSLTRDVTREVDEVMARESDARVAQFIAGLAGPLQKNLLKKGFDFEGTKAILNRRFAGQIQMAERDRARVNTRDLRPEFFNAAYLAGRAGLPLRQTKAILTSFVLRIYWFYGRFVQLVWDAITWRRMSFYATRSAEHLPATIVNGFHLDALVDPAFKGTEAETQTAQHILKRVETANPTREKQADILVVRYQAADDDTVNEGARQKAVEGLKVTLFRLASEKGLGAKVTAYLNRAIIVAEPMGQLIRPSEVLAQAAQQIKQKFGSEIRFDFHSANPEQIDRNDSLVRFVVYALLSGLKVLPISDQLESARVISIQA